MAEPLVHYHLALSNTISLPNGRPKESVPHEVLQEVVRQLTAKNIPASLVFSLVFRVVKTVT
jgi:hypothetical protein